MLQGNEQIKELLNLALNNSHDVVGLLFNAPLRNPGKLVEIIATDDPFGYLCKNISSRIQDIFLIPSHIDTEKVHDVICSANETVLGELYSLSGWRNVRSGLLNKTSATLSDLIENIGGLSKDIMMLIENLPRNFEGINPDASPVEIIISQFYQDLAVNGDQDVYEMIGTVNSLLSSLYGNSADDITKMYFEMFQVYINYANDILSQIDTKNRNLNLGSLFDNTTAWKNTMQFVFGLQENAIDAFLGSTIQIEEVRKRNWNFLFDQISLLTFIVKITVLSKKI